MWKQINNPQFKSIEFDGFKNQAGANSFTLTPQKWIEATHAIGIVLSNLESINSVLIHQGLPQQQRLQQLNFIAITQMKSLLGNEQLKKLK